MNDFDQPLNFDQLAEAGWHCLSELAEVERLAGLADQHTEALAALLDAALSTGCDLGTVQTIAHELQEARERAHWHRMDCDVWRNMIARNSWRLAAARAEKHGRTH